MPADPLRNTTFADRYQSVLVPVIFEPWAQELIRRARPASGEDILDLACGTGVVTRQIARQLPDPGRLTAVDHSAEMLAVAQAIDAHAPCGAEWIEADAAHLPFADSSFDLALCQQALQFFPDRPATLSELRRVLRPGARVLVNVQRELSVNPLLKAQATALEKFIGQEAGAAVRAICGLSSPEKLRELFETAGFRDVTIESVTLTLHHPDARSFAAGAMGGMHTGDKLSGKSQSRISAAIDGFLTELGPCVEGVALRFPHCSHIVEARN